jgi:hypothetical protein
MPSQGDCSFKDSTIKGRINSFWVITVAIVVVLVMAVALISNPINGFSIYQHPENLLAENSLSSAAKVHIVDNTGGAEYLLTGAEEIAMVTAIVEDMRIAKKEISKARGGSSDSRYVIAYYDDIDDSTADYRYSIHVAPVWVYNNVKPSFRYNLVNQEEIIKRLEELLASKDGSAAYDVASLMQNKTLYIGNNSRVGALVNALPLPQGVSRDTIELDTAAPPYGMKINYKLADDTLKISEEQFLRNSVLLFALIDNLEEITHMGFWHNKALSSLPFRFTYTRSDAERIVGGDVRQFAATQASLHELIAIVQMLRDDNNKTAMKGLELYVWRKPELTGNDNIYYTLLLGTNRNKTEDEVYDLAAATTNIDDINREIASYEVIDIIVSHPRSISKQEMEEIVDQLEVKNGSIAVGAGWFDSVTPRTYTNEHTDIPATQINITPGEKM